MASRPKPLLSGALVLVGSASLVAVAAALARRQKRAAVASQGKRKAVVLGLGYCGGAIARRLAQAHDCAVIGTSRGQTDPANARAGVRTVIVGGGQAPAAAKEGRAQRAFEELAESLREADIIVATAPPGEGGDPFLADQCLREAIETAVRKGALVIYLSSVGVYGDQGGNLVTEDTPPAPRTARAKRRLAAEEMWRELSTKRFAIVRLPGIYGAFRGPLAKAGEGNTLIVKEGHLFSRIHVNDVVKLCGKLVASTEEADYWCNGPNVINCCDSEPAPQHEVSALAYQLLGRPVPIPVPFEKAELSAMQRSFYEESRRMGNAKLLNLVGSLEYPSYRSGLRACIEEELALSAAQKGGLQRFRAIGGLLSVPLVALAGRAKSALAFRGPTTRVALVDNGSLKPEATLSLRRLASALEKQATDKGLRVRVEAVSARFADRIPPQDLGGRRAEVLASWLPRVAAEDGQRSKVLLLPLLIGPSSTLTKSMPAAARAVAGLGDVAIAPSLVCLCPVIMEPGTSGAAEVAGMLADNLAASEAADWNAEKDCLFICDHGSPVARVAAAREAVRQELERRCNRSVGGCCMERREGPEFDFNGPLLEDALLALPEGSRAAVLLLFLQEGRHAGPGGDIATIIAGVLEKRPDLKVVTTSVLASHPALVEMLLKRMEKPVPLSLMA